MFKLHAKDYAKHNAEDWCNSKVAKSLPTTYNYSIRYL